MIGSRNVAAAGSKLWNGGGGGRESEIESGGHHRVLRTQHESRPAVHTAFAC